MITVILRRDDGLKLEKTFHCSEIQAAADFCVQHPDYGITLSGDLDENGNEETWDICEWQSLLDAMQ